MKIILNPYFLFCFFYSLMYLSGALKWSSLFSNYSDELNYIFSTLILFSLFLGFIRRKAFKKVTRFYSIRESDKDNKIFIFTVLFFIVEVCYSRTIPIMMDNYSDILEMQFGIPLLHGFYVPFVSYLSIMFFHIFISTKNKKYILYIVVLNFIILLMMRRGLLVFNSLCYVFIFIIYSQSGFEKIKYLKSKLIVISLIILFIFGVIGNARLGDSTGNVVLERGEATQEFINSGIPKTYFFGYMYLASPLHVLDLNLGNHGDDLDTFLINNIVPEFISKRIRSEPFVKEFETLNGFNVGGLLLQPYYDYGIKGIILIFIYLCLFIEITLLLSKNRTRRTLISFSILLSIVTLLTFTNLLVSTAYILQLFYCWIFRGVKL